MKAAPVPRVPVPPAPEPPVLIAKSGLHLAADKVDVAAAKPVTRSRQAVADDLDRMPIVDGREDPAWYEAVMRSIYSDARQDSQLADGLKAAYLDNDIPAAFERFRQSRFTAAISRILKKFGYDFGSAIVEIGCGRGHLSRALYGLGYHQLTAMDPNPNAQTGTGYLASLADHNIRIINDLSSWRHISGQFDAIVSSATVHHWQHIPAVALDARRTLKEGGHWFAMREFFANSPRELVRRLREHLLAGRYGTYEWPYPASAYVELIQSVGYELVAVIPHFYNDNEARRSRPRAPVSDR